MQRGGAFSLLELIVVLAIVSLVLALSAPTLLRAGSRSSEQRALAQLVDALRAARTEAIASRAAAEVRMTPADGALRVDAGSNTLRIDPWPFQQLRVDEESGAGARRGAGGGQQRVQEAVVRFSPSGRADARVLEAASARGGRLWRIAFDAVSGAPGLALAGGEESL